jgi:hypothetical protein
MTTSEATSIEGLRSYNQQLAVRRVEDDPVVQRWHVAKRIVWMITLAGAFLIYYLLDKMHEALSILN